MGKRDLSERKIRYVPPSKTEDAQPTEISRKKRVVAYGRVSTDSAEQETSIESQIKYYTEKIQKNPDWIFGGIYADPAVSGTSRRNRVEFDKMIYDCLHGKIDIILTKSMSRFARNQLDCLAVIKLLKGLKPPITVLFEDDHIDSSDISMDVVITVFSMFAEQESVKKSSNIIWGFERRKEQGFYLTPTHNLLGYDKTKAYHKDDREIIIVEEEANIVRLIFYMFLAGFKVAEIANLLTNAGVATSKGNTIWNSSSILGILKNERYAGDVRTNKTFRDFQAHHTYKNNGERAFVYETDHHIAIIPHEYYEMTQKLIASHKYGYDPYVNGTFSLKIIETGLLQGFIPINIHWAGSSLDDYINLANTTTQTNDLLKKGLKIPYFPGCELIRPQDLAHNKKCCIKITPKSISLNSACIDILKSEYIEILFNPIDKLIAVRPTDKQMPGAVKWKKFNEKKYTPISISCGALTKLIYELMEWPNLWNTSILAEIYSQKGESVMIFDLAQYEINALPYLPPKKKTKKENNDVYYDIELMIAQQIELLHQKQYGTLEYEDNTEEQDENLPKPKRKKLHQKDWANSFGEKSEIAAVQCRRLQAKKLKNWDLSARGNTHKDFDDSVVITDEMIEEKISLLNQAKEEDKEIE